MTDRFKKRSPAADPSPMPDNDAQGSATDGDLFGLVVDRLSEPLSSLGTADERRRLLLAELRGLIERDEYRVDVEAVAEAIIDESGQSRVIDWID